MRRTRNASKGSGALRAAIVLVLLLLLPSAVHAQKRVALVIGNASFNTPLHWPILRTMQPMWPLRCRDLAFKSSQELI